MFKIGDIVKASRKDNYIYAGYGLNPETKRKIAATGFTSFYKGAHYLYDPDEELYYWTTNAPTLVKRSEVKSNKPNWF
jgi:hypothetical protein